MLLNSAYPMELGWMDEYNVDACLWIGDPGQRGFEGVANLLTGKANPSGHLTDTYAANSLSSPAAYTQSQNVAEWSNVDEVLNSGIVTDSPLHVSYTATQAEGIYVGYKYYETRYEDSILNPASGASGTTGSSFGGGWNYAAEVTYPFGYGLSYTTFEQTLNSVSYDADQDMFTATVTVKTPAASAANRSCSCMCRPPTATTKSRTPWKIRRAGHWLRQDRRAEARPVGAGHGHDGSLHDGQL